jgi:CRP-like cAMP-binding protein
MLAATRRARKQVYGPATVILRQGEPVEQFFMVVRGEVEIVLGDGGSGEMRLARLGAGQFFGEIELTRGGGSRASVRAAPGADVELALLPKEEFTRLVGESALARKVLDEVAGDRLTENLRSRDPQR